MPGQSKIVSTSTVPPSAQPKERPIIVRLGMKALRTA